MITSQEVTLRKFDRNSYKMKEFEVECDKLKSVEQPLSDIDDDHAEQLMKYLEIRWFIYSLGREETVLSSC